VGLETAPSRETWGAKSGEGEGDGQRGRGDAEVGHHGVYRRAPAPPPAHAPALLAMQTLGMSWRSLQQDRQTGRGLCSEGACVLSCMPTLEQGTAPVPSVCGREGRRQENGTAGRALPSVPVSTFSPASMAPRSTVSCARAVTATPPGFPSPSHDRQPAPAEAYGTCPHPLHRPYSTIHTLCVRPDSSERSCGEEYCSVAQ